MKKLCIVLLVLAVLLLACLTGCNSTESAATTAQTTQKTPAAETPATQTPGTQTPATQTSATQTSETQTPGTETPGTQTAATQTPATAAPVTTAPTTASPSNIVNVKTIDEIVTAADKYVNIVLANDIDASSLTESIFLYDITLDGNGFKITHLSVPLLEDVSNATVKNLVIADSAIISSETDIGIIAKTAQLKAVFSNITIEASCSLKADIDGNCQVGAIVGRAAGSTTGEFSEDILIENCINYANIERSNSAKRGMVGGIVGSLNAGAIKNCVNYGDVTYNNTAQGNVGGILGNAYGTESGGIGYVTVDNCFNTGDIYGGITAGGIVGYTNHYDERAYSNCVSVGGVSGAQWNGLIGCFRGNGANNTFTNCFWLNAGETGGITCQKGSADNVGIENCEGFESIDDLYSALEDNEATSGRFDIVEGKLVIKQGE